MRGQFKVGDLVMDATDKRRVGIVLSTYAFQGQTRCVVRFEDGSERVFFDFELVPAGEADSQ
ncbi:MAG TPA: hypothetical protein VE422_16165 [Terriglobia bacterium]|nr:hypothetical protein [Terriglobia bacterium]